LTYFWLRRGLPARINETPLIRPEAAGRSMPMKRLRVAPVVGIAALLAVGLSAVCGGQLDKSGVASKGISPPPDARIFEDGWFAHIKRAIPAPPLPSPIGRAFMIEIKGPIDSTTYGAVRRKVLKCKKDKPQLVLFDMDTPGGEGEAMKKIVSLITEDLKDIYTVAYADPEAISAGAYIALACDEIVISPMGKIGAAMPIMIGPQGIIELPEKVRGKFESYGRAAIRSLAKANGYNPDLCEAMVTLDMEIWLIRNVETRELRIVDAADWRDKVSNPPTGGKGQEVGKKESRWEFLRILDGPKELVTLTADEAVFVGIARRELASIEELKQAYNITGEMLVLSDNWSERLVGFLTSPVVSSILFFAAVLCAYVEINTPGFGVPGALAIACFSILFGSRFLIGLATWWEIALVVIGVILFLVEVFITPGFGVLGVAGILCVIIGLLGMVVPNAPDKLPIPKTPLDWSMFVNGATALAVGFLCSVVAMVFVARFLPKTPFASRLILAPAEVPVSPATEDAPIRSIRPGEVGVVNSPLRPVGTVRFGDNLVDAVAESAFVQPGTKVKVVKNEGNRVMVTPTE